MDSVIRGVFLYVEILLLVFWGYWFFISLFGFGRPKKIKEHEKTKRFLMLIPAHNEETVIGHLIQNMNNLSYPKHLYDIFVIADNCTDDTAYLSRLAGAKVIEHYSRQDESKGKPYAIKYAFEILKNELDQYDAFCVFDADNLVSTNYLSEMNNHLNRGDRLIQCYLDSKNASDNWISLSYATSYFYMNRSWQLAKDRLGLGNAIGGTGFCVEMDVLKEVGWTVKSLTEDLEFQMQCLLSGISARWCHVARVYDEKPTGFKISCVQRLRWARGHWDVCIRYSWWLFKRGITRFDLNAFDGLFYLLNPGKIVIGSVTTLLVVMGIFLQSNWFKPIVPFWIWISLISFQAIYVFYCLFKDSSIKMWKVLLGVLYLPIFNAVYVPLFIWAFLTKKNKIWKRTDHTRGLTLNDVMSKSRTTQDKPIAM